MYYVIPVAYIFGICFFFLNFEFNADTAIRSNSQNQIIGLYVL